MKARRVGLLIHHSSFSIHHLLSRFRDFAALDAGGADFHAHVPALRALHANFLQVGIETTPGAIVRVGDVVAELRPFAADFASFCHDCFRTSET
jgi:hypothetical protein